MKRAWVARGSGGVFALCLGVSVASTVTAQERERTQERSVAEDVARDGGATPRAEVVTDTFRRGGTTRQTQRAFVTDVNGRQRLESTVVEERVERADGGHEIVRDVVESTAGGGSRTTRREREELVVESDGVFLTRTEVAEPSVNGSRFVPVELVEEREYRDGDRLVERERVTYQNPTGRGDWDVLEQRLLTRDSSAQGVRDVEVVYRPDASGDLVLSERIVSRERTGAGGRTIRTEQVFGRDINDRGALTRLPVQEVEEVRVDRGNGRSETTRTTSERRGDRMQAAERVIERTRPDGRGTVIEREVQRADINGRFRTVATSRTTVED